LLRGTTLIDCLLSRGNHLIQVRLQHFWSDTLGSDNGARSVKAYSGKSLSVCGSRVHSILCAGTGSHLTRLSEPRWRLTSLVPSLYSIRLWLNI